MDTTEVGPMEPVATGLVYDDLLDIPEYDLLRHELIDGAHYVTPAPHYKHQIVVMRLGAQAHAWTESNGGLALPAPTDVRFTDSTVLEPDLVLLSAERAAALSGDRTIDVVPSLVVEVSSPTTRTHDLLRKRRVYERYRVDEFWFVDLDAERVEQYVLGEDGYGAPRIIERGAALRSVALDGLTVDVGALFDTLD